MNCKLLKLEAEEKKALVIAKNLLQAGLAINLVVDSTGLSIEEIEKLKDWLFCISLGMLLTIL